MNAVSHQLENLQQRIVLEALKVRGLFETEGLGLESAVRDELLRLGWCNDWPFHMAFCELVWRRAHNGRPELPYIKTFLNASALSTFNRAAREEWTEQVPVQGSIGIMRNGDTAQGHSFIVVKVGEAELLTLEVAQELPVSIVSKTRPLVYNPTNGWHLVGFINPKTLA